MGDRPLLLPPELEEVVKDVVADWFGDEMNVYASSFARHVLRRAGVPGIIAWSDELRDRIRDIYLNTSREALNRDDVAGEEIASAEKECRLRHEAIVRALARKPKESS